MARSWKYREIVKSFSSEFEPDNPRNGRVHGILKKLFEEGVLEFVPGSERTMQDSPEITEDAMYRHKETGIYVHYRADKRYPYILSEDLEVNTPGLLFETNKFDKSLENCACLLKDFFMNF